MARSAEKIVTDIREYLRPGAAASGDVRLMPVFLDCPHHGKWRWRDTMDGPVLSPDCPHCIRDRKLSSELGRAAIPKRFQHHSLGTFVVETPAQQVALDVCREFCANTRRTLDEGRNLLFVGTVGTGKTHLACAVAREFIDAGHTALYIRVADLISLVRETWRPDSKKTERKVYKELSEYDLLVLDEVGVQAGTENEQNILLNVISARNENMRPMILMSNLTPKQVGEALGERSYDRIREAGRVVKFTWESYRGKHR